MSQIFNKNLIDTAPSHRLTLIPIGFCPYLYGLCISVDRSENAIIFLQVYDAHLLPGHNVLKAMNLVAGSTVGVFKCDIGTVYAAPGKHCSFITVQSMLQQCTLHQVNIPHS